MTITNTIKLNSVIRIIWIICKNGQMEIMIQQKHKKFLHSYEYLKLTFYYFFIKSFCPLKVFLRWTFLCTEKRFVCKLKPRIKTQLATNFPQNHHTIPTINVVSYCMLARAVGFAQSCSFLQICMIIKSWILISAAHYPLGVVVFVYRKGWYLNQKPADG